MVNGCILGLVGFGEAAQAFCEGWGATPPASIAAYDRKVDDPVEAAGKEADYARFGVLGLPNAIDLADSVDAAFCLVTADQALAAAEAHGEGVREGAFFFDGNSVAPATKRQAAAVIEAAGGRYVDVAIMAPVRPALLAVPLLVTGPHAVEGQRFLAGLGLDARVVAGGVGAASAIKMIRSIMVKGLEALTAECLLSAHAAGVEEEVLASLDASFPGWDWQARGDYNLDRMIVHGRRRAAEMREAAATAAALGQVGAMAVATADWQEWIGALSLTPPDGLAAKAAALLDTTGTRAS